MSDIALTLDKVLEEVGFTARMEAKAEARGEATGGEKRAVEIAQKMLKSGFPIGQVAELSGLDVERVTALAP